MLMNIPHKSNVISFPLLILIVFLPSCIKLENDTPQNPMLPIEQAGGAFNLWFHSLQNYKSPALPMAVMADQLTWDFESPAFSKFGAEPRIQFANTRNSQDNLFTQQFWSDSYTTLYYANNALNEIKKSTDVNLTDYYVHRMKAWCYFIQGIVHGYLGLCFDQAYIINETTSPTVFVLYPYHQVITKAADYLYKAAIMSDEYDFTITNNWILGYEITNTQLAQLANTFAARFLLYSSRNASQNELANWSNILELANNGITFDFEPEFYFELLSDNLIVNGMAEGKARIDCRIINLMDPDHPARYPANGEPPDPSYATSEDDRLLSDFEHLEYINFSTSLGYYLFSHYRFKRYDDWINYYHGSIPIIRKEELELIKAEALVHLGNLAEAITILNNGTRVTRGKLLPLESDSQKEKILEAIFYERDIELTMTGLGISFFDMRRRDMLQYGTLLHFPVPANILLNAEMDLYTFGGVENADGINTSNAGWF
ncbi:hypothetical protein ES705_19191 [subsurface metagenome]